MVNIRNIPQDIPSFEDLDPFVFRVISQPLSCLPLRSAGSTPSPSAGMSLADARCVARLPAVNNAKGVSNIR